MALNQVQLIGNLGNDPEIRAMPNGGNVANLSIATTEKWKDKQTGERKEATEWHRVVIFGKLADVVGQYLKKGSKVYIQGSLRTRKWTDQAGIEKYTTEIVVAMNGKLEMLDSKPQEGGQTGDWGTPQQPKANPPARSGPPASGGSNEPPMDFDDDIPF